MGKRIYVLFLCASLQMLLAGTLNRQAYKFGSVMKVWIKLYVLFLFFYFIFYLFLCRKFIHSWNDHIQIFFFLKRCLVHPY